ncbi:MAG TPA: J domain-containing protein [Thermomicrobiales bacterium]|nr:J domain-containing protein [Thermomicrobiales bacterium]
MEKSRGDRNGRTEVVRALPPAEQQYQRHLITIGERRRDLAQLERDLARLRDAVTGFEALAQARLGELFAELRRLEGATADFSHRVARLRAALDTRDLDELDLDELDLEDDDLLTGASFGASGARGIPRGPHVPAAARRWLATEAAEAKRLYIDLAKRLHPDLARDDEERQRRERIMQRVNEAFRLRDLAGLRAVHLESIAEDPGWAERPVTDRLAWAEEELRRLAVALEEARLAMARLRGGELFRLYTRYESGEPVFADLKIRIEERIATETRRLDRLKSSYRRLVDRWRKVEVAEA